MEGIEYNELNATYHDDVDEDLIDGVNNEDIKIFHNMTKPYVS